MIDSRRIQEADLGLRFSRSAQRAIATERPKTQSGMAVIPAVIRK